jgi:hypothetical protein
VRRDIDNLRATCLNLLAVEDANPKALAALGVAPPIN